MRTRANAPSTMYESFRTLILVADRVARWLHTAPAGAVRARSMAAASFAAEVRRDGQVTRAPRGLFCA